MNLNTYLSTPATPNDCSERPSRKISRHVLQDPLPPNAALYIANLGLGKPGLESVGKRSSNFHFNLEISNSDVDGMDVREGKILLVVVQDVQFRLVEY